MSKLLKFFKYEHLPEYLKRVSSECSKLADYAVDNIPANAEREVGLRKLLEAKDCFVRAQLEGEQKG